MKVVRGSEPSIAIAVNKIDFIRMDKEIDDHYVITIHIGMTQIHFNYNNFDDANERFECVIHAIESLPQ